MIRNLFRRRYPEWQANIGFSPEHSLIFDTTTGRLVLRFAGRSADMINRFRCQAASVVTRQQAALCPAHIAPGNRMINPSRLGIRTLGKVSALIVSFSPISLFWAKMYAVNA